MNDAVAPSAAGRGPRPCSGPLTGAGLLAMVLAACGAPAHFEPELSWDERMVERPLEAPEEERLEATAHWDAEDRLAVRVQRVTVEQHERRTDSTPASGVRLSRSSYVGELADSGYLEGWDATVALEDRSAFLTSAVVVGVALVPWFLAGTADLLGLAISWPVAAMEARSRGAGAEPRVDVERFVVESRSPVERFRLRSADGLLELELRAPEGRAAAVARAALGGHSWADLRVEAGGLECDLVLLGADRP